MKTDLKKVVKAVEYAKKYSPFYAKRLANISPRAIKTFEDFAQLPFTTKDEVALYENDLLAADERDIIEIATTSGSTGSPLITKMTAKDTARLAYNEECSLSTAGITKDDTVILAVTMDKCFVAGLAYYSGLNKIGAKSVRVGPTSPEMLLNLAQTVRATTIIGVPTYLERIYDYATEHEISIKTLFINKLVCIGEPIRDELFQLNAIGKRLQEKWQCNLFSTYGITELQTSFCECSAGQGGHIYPDLVHIEIVDENDALVPYGEPGEVVATPLGITGMPLLRFKTGDISFIIDKQCDCSREGNRLGPILGRKKQKLKIKGTSVYPQAFINILNAIDKVDEFAIVATAESELSDSLEILISFKKGEKPDMKRIANKIRGLTKITPVISLVSSAEIIAITRPEGSRKIKRFVDKRAEK
ncbi:AMP-binding protein [bacterium]|nr:AMP-binding protein [bacterium]